MNALVLLTWAVLASDPGLKDVYTWVDEDGITHYTNTPEEIPARYRRTRKGVKGVELGVVTSAGSGGRDARAVRSTSFSSRGMRSAPNEQAWRGRFRAARAQIDSVRRQIRSANEEIKRLSVGRVMDSGGFLVTHPDLQPTKDRLRELEQELGQAEDALRSLHREAGEEGVPQAWR